MVTMTSTRIHAGSRGWGTLNLSRFISMHTALHLFLVDYAKDFITVFLENSN
jgi:glycerol-3-phosphate acyltransferase PlsY